MVSVTIFSLSRDNGPSKLENFNVFYAYLRVLSFEFLKFRILKILNFYPWGCLFSALENMSAVKEQQKKFTTYSSDFSKRLAHHLNNLFIHQVMYRGAYIMSNHFI